MKHFAQRDHSPFSSLTTLCGINFRETEPPAGEELFVYFADIDEPYYPNTTTCMACTMLAFQKQLQSHPPGIFGHTAKRNIRYAYRETSKRIFKSTRRQTF